MAAYRHHFIQDEAEVPSKYQSIRQTFEDGSLRGPSRYEQSIRNDFMGNSDDRLILPFFDQERFTANNVAAVRDTGSYTKIPLDIQVYNRIKPALRLASLLILRHLPLWLLILYAPEVVDMNGETSLDEDVVSRRFLDHFRDSFLNVDLSNMASITSIGWHARREESEVGMSTIAWAAPMHRPQNHHLILLMSGALDLWALFQTTSDWKESTHEEKCSNWVHLAVTLVHEFAHCLTLYRHRRIYERIAQQYDASPCFAPDPLISLWPVGEVGYSFEMSAFGGLFDMFTLENVRRGNFAPSIFTSKGKQTPGMRFLQGDDMNRMSHAEISPDTVVALMQESTWRGTKGDGVVDLYLWKSRLAPSTWIN